MIKKTFFQITDSFRLNIKLFCYTHLTYMSVLEFDCDFCFTSSKYLYCSPILEKHQMPKIHDLKFLVNNAFFQMMRVFYIIIKRLFFCYFKLFCHPWETRLCPFIFSVRERARGREREGEGEREQERENRKNKLFFLILQKHLMRDKLCSLNSCKHFAKPSQFF